MQIENMCKYKEHMLVQREELDQFKMRMQGEVRVGSCAGAEQIAGRRLSRSGRQAATWTSMDEEVFNQFQGCTDALWKQHLEWCWKRTHTKNEVKCFDKEAYYIEI